MSKISAYSAIGSVQSDDLLVVVDVHDTSMGPAGTTKKMTVSQLPGAVNSVNGHTGTVVLAASDVGADASGAAAAAQAASLPLTGGTLTGPLAVGGALTTAPVTLTDATTITVNAAQSDYFRVTLGGNRTLGAPSNPADGQAITFEIIQDGTGSRTLAYNAVYSFPASIGTPVLSTTPGFHDFLAFRYDSAATTWYCVGFVPQSTAAAPATVAQGGTGQSSLTAYALLAGGTTTTGAVQSLAGLGSSGNVLSSNGAAALPSFGALTAAQLPTGTTSAKGALQLDGTAADIQAAGTQTAGANGLAADSGHIHPDMYGAMGDLGTLLGHSLPYPMAAGTFLITTAGTLNCTRIRVPAGGTCANFYAFISTAGNTVANVYTILFDLNGNILFQSANRAADSALTTSASLWTVPWASSGALAAGDCYGAILVGSATTQPTFRAGTSSSAAVVNLGRSVGSKTLRAATFGSSLTSPPGSVTMASMASAAGAIWMAVGP